MAKYGPSQERRVEKNTAFRALLCDRHAALQGRSRPTKAWGCVPVHACALAWLGVRLLFWVCHNEREDLPTPALSLHRPRTQASKSRPCAAPMRAGRRTECSQDLAWWVGSLVAGRLSSLASTVRRMDPCQQPRRPSQWPLSGARLPSRYRRAGRTHGDV